MKTPKNINFLVVDDMTFTHSFILQSLKKLGFEGNIFAAKNMQSAIDKIKDVYKNKMKIDIIITDLHLPDGNGIELTRKIRGTSSLVNIPIIMMTTDENSHLVIEAFEAGVDNYFFKPIDDDILREKIEFAWQKKHGNKAS